MTLDGILLVCGMPASRYIGRPDGGGRQAAKLEFTSFQWAVPAKTKARNVNLGRPIVRPTTTRIDSMIHGTEHGKGDNGGPGVDMGGGL